jgi:LysR family transcriptional regulator, nitrogen assimilation regulatory protein
MPETLDSEARTPERSCVEIRQLRYFLKIAELGSLSRASQALHVAQPALSHQMAQLEAELGHALLHRRYNGVQVTEQGQAFYSQAQRILKDIDDLPNVVANSAAHLRGTVAVGLPQSTAVHFAMPLLAALAQRHPGVGLEFFDEISGNLLHGLNSGRVDIAVIVNDEAAKLTHATLLMEEDLFLVSADASALENPLPVDRLATLRLTLPSLHQGVRGVVEDAVRAAGAVLPVPAVVANSMSIMRRAIESEGLCGVMPWGAVCDEIRAGALHAIPMLPRLSRRVYVCSSRDAELSLAARAVRELLIELTRARVQSGDWQGVCLP